MLRRILIMPALACYLIALPALAHDLWIEASSFSPLPGARVSLALRVGEHLVGDPVPRDPAMIRRFTVSTAERDRVVPGLPGRDPAGVMQASGSGLQVVGFESAPYYIELAGDKFTEYLVEEGLDHVIALRASRNAADAHAREFYARSAKALLQTGAPGAGDGDRVLGLPLELVAERNPYALTSGDELPVRLTFNGQPLQGTLVMAINRADPQERHAARSDADGRVRFRLHASGLWLVKAVHMTEASDRAKADWTSWWASLTFEGPGLPGS